MRWEPNTQMIENSSPEELVFEERCEFCDENLEFQHVYEVVMGVENPITLCEYCYRSFIVGPFLRDSVAE